MNLQNILLASASLGGMGLLFGAGLAYASQKFAVEVDERAVAVLEATPGANCGGCGYPGCAAFANAVAAKEAPVDGCPVGGADTAEKIAQIMGVEVSSGAKQVARVLCQGDNTRALEDYAYQGITSCLAANMLDGGPKTCKAGCMGLGSCEQICPFDAIHVNDKGLAVVDKDKCTACNKCVVICPKNVIELVPYEQQTIVDCKNTERGGHVKKNCEVACIACGICERSCPFDAVHVVNNIARIDYDKCTNCMICAEKCPTKAIYAEFDKRKTAFIDAETCIGCTKCAKVCPVDAIEGAVKENHVVDPEICVGCEACVGECPVDAISMK